jgi:hypothetical protein
MSTLTARAIVPAAFVLLLALAACSAPATPAPVTTPDAATAVPTETPTPTAEPLVFTQPETCMAILPESRLDAFASEGLVLLGGPDGKYGTEYLADATPEEEAGGISCIWGFADSEASSLTVSVAPLSIESRASAVTSFGEQGLNEEVVGDAIDYGVQGDRSLNPAIINVLRAESWISVIATIGGTDAYADSVAIAGEVAGLVYTAP